MTKFFKVDIMKGKTLGTSDIMNVTLDDNTVLKSYKYVDIGIIGENMITLLNINDRCILELQKDYTKMLIKAVKTAR